MKKLLFYSSMTAYLFIAGCKDGSHTGDSAMLEASHQVYKGIETGDTALLNKYIADDAIDHGGGADGGDVKGPEIISMLAGIHNDIDNLKMDVVQEATNADHVFTLVHMTGTTNKPVWGMPANFTIDNKSIDLLKMAEGKITEHWGFMEMAEMMKMMPPSASPQGMGMNADSAGMPVKDTMK